MKKALYETPEIQVTMFMRGLDTIITASNDGGGYDDNGGEGDGFTPDNDTTGDNVINPDPDEFGDDEEDDNTDTNKLDTQSNNDSIDAINYEADNSINSEEVGSPAAVSYDDDWKMD